MRAAVVAASALLVLAGLLQTASAANAADVVTVPMPGPGHQNAWSTTVQNPSSAASKVYLSVVGVTGGAADIDDELTLSVQVDGVTVIPSTPVRRMLDAAPVALGTVAGGGAKAVSGDVALSAAAGDAYQGQSAQVTLRLSSVLPESAPPPLADTGLAVIGFGVPVALVSAGAVFLLRRRKQSAQQ